MIDDGKPLPGKNFSTIFEKFYGDSRLVHKKNMK